MNYIKSLNQIKNAQMAGKQNLRSPFSIMNFRIAKILVAQRYLKSVAKVNVDGKDYLDIELIYKKGDQPAIGQIKFISKPGRRVYRRCGDLRIVRQGFGLAVISTSRGLMTNKNAKKNKIGGEYLFEIYR